MANLFEFIGKAAKIRAWFAGVGGKKDARKAKRRNKKRKKDESNKDN